MKHNIIYVNIIQNSTPKFFFVNNKERDNVHCLNKYSSKKCFGDKKIMTSGIRYNIR